MQEQVVHSIGGAHLVQYEANKFKIIKDSSFQDVKPRNQEISDAKYDTIAVLAHFLYSELNSLYGLEKTYHGGIRISPSSRLGLEDLLAEIITNAEQHGNKYDLSKVTWIDYSFDEDNKTGTATFRVTVRDEGTGFDHRHVRAAEQNARGTSRGYNQYRDRTQEENGHGLFQVLRYF